MQKRHHAIVFLFFAINKFHCLMGVQKDYNFPKEENTQAIVSLKNLCLNTMYQNKIPFSKVPTIVKESIPSLVQKQTLDYALFNEIFKNPCNPNLIVIKELLQDGANPNFQYPFSTVQKKDGKNIWKKADKNKAGLCVVTIIAKQPEFNQKMRDVMDVLLEHGANLKIECDSDPHIYMHEKITPIKLASKMGNSDFVNYAKQKDIEL